MKKGTVIGALLLFMFLLWKCGDKQIDRSTGQDESVVNAQPVRMEYNELTLEQRKAKLAECASCHPEETHNELIGPHAQSYAKLLEHQKIASDPKCFQRPYEAFLKDNFEDACASCHAPQNLFETNYFGLDTLNDLSAFSKDNFPDAWRIPESRKGEDVRTSGIDCLSCHLKGDAVITNHDYTVKTDPPACNPQPSKFFSSDYNCVSCHSTTMEGLTEFANNSNENGVVSCNGCHMEKDGTGDFTHYYFWRHDHKSKEQFPLLRAVLDDIQITKLNEGVLFEWKNQQAPHRFSECAELSAKLSFIDEKGKVCMVVDKRLNNKSHHDNALKPYFNETPIWGEYGCEFLPFDDSCVDTLRFSGQRPVKIEIHGYEKPQYWLNDSLAHKIYTRTIEL